MIKSGGFLRNMLYNLGKKVITDLAITLARNNLSGLVSNLASNAVKKFGRKISGRRDQEKDLLYLFPMKI